MCQSRYARPNVDRNAPKLVTHDFALAGVQSRSNLDPKRANVVGNGARATDGARRSVKCCEEAIACGVNLAATMS